MKLNDSNYMQLFNTNILADWSGADEELSIIENNILLNVLFKNML